MKNTVKWLGIIAVIVIIGIVITACGDSHTCVFGEWEVTISARCTMTGIESRTCTHDNCGEKETRSISALGHNFSGWVVTIPASCTEGTETETCTRNGCNEKETRSIALGHIFSDWLVTTPASCTEGEETETCTRNGCNEKETRSIALGHNFEGWVVTTLASCTEGEETGTCIRENCNETGTRSIALGHNFGGWVTTILPTISTTGQEMRTCQRVGCSFSETRSLSYSAPPTVTIQNNTGYSINDVYIKASTATNWGSDLIPSMTASLSNGASKTFTLSQALSTNSVYDIRLTRTGQTFVKYGVTVSNGIIITFTASDLTDDSNLPRITIQNRSGVSFNSVFIKPSVSSAWGTGFGSISNNSYSTVTIPIPSSNYSVFDIQATSTNPANTYTMSNVTISNGMILTFTSADSDNPLTTNPIIVIQNNTGYSINDVYIKASTATNWGSDLIPSMTDSLSNGASRTFTLSQPLSTNSVYDIRLTRTGQTFTKYGVTVTNGMIITFSIDDIE